MAILRNKMTFLVAPVDKKTKDPISAGLGKSGAVVLGDVGNTDQQGRPVHQGQKTPGSSRRLHVFRNVKT